MTDGPAGGLMEVPDSVPELRRRVAQQRRELDALAEINRAIVSQPGRGRVLQRIVEEASKLIGADGAGIAFLGPTGEALEVGPAIGVLEIPHNRTIPLHGSITGRVVRSGVAEAIPDVTRDPDQYPLEPDPVPTRSAVVAPLRTTKVVLGGLLGVRGPGRPSLGPEQRDALQRFADQAAIAIEQARLFERLKDANDAKEAFVATLSHELRTPLTGILLWTDLLGVDPGLEHLERGREAVDVISQSADSMLAMVNDLLELGRVEAGKLRLERRPVDLAVLARQALAAFRQQERSGSEVEIDDQLPERMPAIRVDPGRVQQVVNNLLSNALKFTAPPGRITVRAHMSEDESTAVLEVEDTGIGIAPDALPQIFQRFRQGGPTATRQRGGLGVGLTVARALVEAHGGVIRVRSEVDVGSTFTVEFPVTERVDEDTPGSSTADGAAMVGRAGGVLDDDTPVSVLVAEDVMETRQALATILSAHGYRVLEARDGDQAVDRARAERPAAVLMDIAMPNVDGISALERLRADPQTVHIPIAAVTARAMPDDRRRVEGAGFDAYLVKPFRISELLGTLDELLGARPGPSAV